MTLIWGMTPEAQGVLQEDIGVAGQALHPFLDARAAGVIQTDDRGADLQRLGLHLDDLLRLSARERTAEDREILGEDVDHPPVDCPPPRHPPPSPGMRWASMPKSWLPVLHEHVKFFERALVEKKPDPLARRQLAPWRAAPRYASHRPPARAWALRRSSSSRMSCTATSPTLGSCACW